MRRVDRGIHIFEEKSRRHGQEQTKNCGQRHVARPIGRRRHGRQFRPLHDLDVGGGEIVRDVGFVHALQDVVIKTAIDDHLFVEHRVVDADLFEAESGLLLVLGLFLQRLFAPARRGVRRFDAAHDIVDLTAQSTPRFDDLLVDFLHARVLRRKDAQQPPFFRLQGRQVAFDLLDQRVAQHLAQILGVFVARHLIERLGFDAIGLGLGKHPVEIHQPFDGDVFAFIERHHAMLLAKGIELLLRRLDLISQFSEPRAKKILGFLGEAEAILQNHLNEAGRMAVGEVLR